MDMTFTRLVSSKMDRTIEKIIYNGQNSILLGLYFSSVIPGSENKFNIMRKRSLFNGALIFYLQN